MSLAGNLAPVAGLVGTWTGDGRGGYPTIDPFDYTEEITFADVGKPFLVYTQRTRSADGAPLHVETGYLRLPGDGSAEFVLAQPTGQAELAEGTVTVTESGVVLELRARVLNSGSAKRVDETARVYTLIGDELRTSFAMAAVGESVTPHLESVLHRA